MKHYYALFNTYGVNAKGGEWYKAFPTLKSRADWLRAHELDRDGNIVARAATRAEVVKDYGKDFKIGFNGWIE